MSSVAPAPEPTNKQTPSRSKASSNRGAVAPPSAAVSSVATSTTTSSAKDETAAPSDGEDDALLQSISQRQSVLMQPLITITLYIPSSCVGAVIGRRGQTIAQVQKQAGQASTTNHPVRVSVIGGDNTPLDSSSLPYTYSELDFSDPNWTPVVIRADPKAAFTAASKLEEILTANDSNMDDVVVDIPLSRQKHAAVVGKRGLVLANLSADTQVRIMVPNKDRRHDVVQLEGKLSNVKTCLERLLVIASKATNAGAATAASSSGSASGATPNARSHEPAPSTSSQGGTTTQHVQTIVVEQPPSQTKIRGLSRKTDTTIKKKRAEGGEGWQVTVSGPSAEQVQAAIQSLQKATTDNNNNSANTTAAVDGGGGSGSGGGRGGTNTSATTAAGTTSNAPKRGKNRGRGGGSNNNKGSTAPKRRGSGNTNKADPPASSSASA